MKKKLYIFSLISFLALIFILNPLSNNLSVKANEVDSLQVLKNDRAQDGTIKEEAQPIYDKSEAFLEDYNKKNSNSLEIEVAGIVDNELILLAINQTEKPIKNLSFDLNLEGIFENERIESKQNASGTLNEGNIYPIKLELTDEEIAQYENHAPYESVNVTNVKIENVSTANYWILYFINLILSIIAYKLGFARELPFKKEIFVYIMLAIGVFILTIFNLMDFPITESLIIISLVLGIYRFRLHLTRKKEAKETT